MASVLLNASVRHAWPNGVASRPNLRLLANPFGQGLRFVEPTYVTGQEDPASRDSTAQSMSFHSGARDSNTLPK